MTAESYQEAETVTRSIARWGSVAAALMFGIGFVTDKTLSWEIVTGQVVQISLIVGIFCGYALALTKRFEVMGSVIALLATFSFCLVVVQNMGVGPTLIFAAVGAPALFHLAAVAFHRYAAPGLTTNQ